MLWQLGWFVLEDEVSLRDPEDSIFLIATSSSNMRLALDFLDKEFNFQYTVFPRIVSALEQFPPLNSFRICMYCDQRSQYIRLNSKKNSFRGNYSRKYGKYLHSLNLDVCEYERFAAFYFRLASNNEGKALLKFHQIPLRF